MYERGKSDSFVVPGKSANEPSGTPRGKERMEGRGLAKGNSQQRNRNRTQCRARLQQSLERVRQAALRDKTQKLTALWHHVYDVDRLRESYFSLKKDAAAGIDGETWRSYGANLEENLHDLAERLRHGTYRAAAVRRTYIPKADGRQRPIGIPTLEDKLVQRTAAEVMGAVYEADLRGFSYGFRPGRSQHNALDALSVGIEWRGVSWILDADIRGFFDTIEHEWLMKFIEHRIADQRVHRHVKKWLKAGVLEEGRWTQAEEGTPQGGSISPLLANIYLHYVLDLWVDAWRKKVARGEVIVVRYADDFVVGFAQRRDAERFLTELKERFQKFGLELHPEKTRLIEFGRYAAKERARRGDGKPETFDFLGFTHICARTFRGRFKILRQTMRKRIRAKLLAIRVELRRRMHDPIPEVGGWLQAVLEGHYRYYAVPGNTYALTRMREQTVLLWRRSLRNRSQLARVSWERVQQLSRRWLPYPRVLHPYPEERLCVKTCGKSPVR